MRGAPRYAGCTPDNPKIDPMHMPKHTLEDPMHGMQPSEKKLDLILISSSLLPFFVLTNLLLLDLRACEMHQQMHFLLPLELGNLSWLKVNTQVKD